MVPPGGVADPPVPPDGGEAPPAAGGAAVARSRRSKAEVEPLRDGLIKLLAARDLVPKGFHLGVQRKCFWCVTYTGTDTRMAAQKSKGKTWKTSDKVADEMAAQKAPLIVVLKWAWEKAEMLRTDFLVFDIAQRVEELCALP